MTENLQFLFETEEQKLKRLNNYKINNEYKKQTGYFQQPEVKERLKLFQKRYRLQERIKKAEHNLYTKPRNSFNIENLKNEIININKLLCV